LCGILIGFWILWTPKLCRQANITPSQELNVLDSVGVVPFLEVTDRDPISSLKWLLGGFLTTVPPTSPKRQIEDDDTEHSRKRQLSMAVDEMEAALLRLRGTTAKSPISVIESSMERINHDTNGQWKHGEDWTDISDESDGELMDYAREIKKDEKSVAEELGIEGKFSTGPFGHDKLDFASAKPEFDGQASSELSFDECWTKERSDKDIGKLEYSRTPESCEELKGKVEKMGHCGKSDDTNDKDHVDKFENRFKHTLPSKISEPEAGELRKQSYHGTPEIEGELANTESSLVLFEDDLTPSSQYYQTESSADGFSPISPSFYLTAQEIKRYSESPCPSRPPQYGSTSTNRFSTDKSNPPFRYLTPIKQESPPNHPLLLNTPIAPLFAAELFPENITPRSPARQARLESQNRVKRLLHDYNFASTTDKEIYVPNLTQTKPEEFTATTKQPSDEGTKVWDVRVIELDEKTVRLVRIGEGICV